MAPICNQVAPVFVSLSPPKLMIISDLLKCPCHWLQPPQSAYLLVQFIKRDYFQFWICWFCVLQILQCEDIQNTTSTRPKWTNQCCRGHCILGPWVCGDHKCWQGWFTWSRKWPFCRNSSKVEGFKAKHAYRSPWYGSFILIPPYPNYHHIFKKKGQYD